MLDAMRLCQDEARCVDKGRLRPEQHPLFFSMSVSSFLVFQKIHFLPDHANSSFAATGYSALSTLILFLLRLFVLRRGSGFCRSTALLTSTSSKINSHCSGPGFTTLACVARNP